MEKNTYSAVNLFQEDYDPYDFDQDNDDVVDIDGDYSLVQQPKSKLFEYTVFDAYGILIAKWSSTEDCLNMPLSTYDASSTKKIFLQVIKQTEKENEIKRAQKKSFGYDITIPDDSDDSSQYSSTFDYHYEKPKGTTGFLDKLNKSDTLVLHSKDPTTEMLCQVYDGKGWDVIRDGNIDKDELHQLLQNHKKIVMLGHGCGSGLMNRQGWGLFIGSEEAQYLKDKQLFVIWCNADQYFKTHNLGHGMFITGNMPSDYHEAQWVGYTVGQKYMDDNITYWCKLCGDVCERALNGDAKGAVQYVRDKYWEKYGHSENPDEVGITKYNYDRTKVQD